VGGNIYVAIEMVGFIICTTCWIIGMALLVFVEWKFVKYIKEHDQKLWVKYENFKPGRWGRILKFIRTMDETDDVTIKELCLQLYKYEKFAALDILVAVLLFALMIITVVITE
jgi:hypothetical protein